MGLYGEHNNQWNWRFSKSSKSDHFIIETHCFGDAPFLETLKRINRYISTIIAYGSIYWIIIGSHISRCRVVPHTYLCWFMFPINWWGISWYILPRILVLEAINKLCVHQLRHHVEGAGCSIRNLSSMVGGFGHLTCRFGWISPNKNQAKAFFSDVNELTHLLKKCLDQSGLVDGAWTKTAWWSGTLEHRCYFPISKGKNQIIPTD